MIKDLLSKLLRGGKDIRSKLLGRIKLVNESLTNMNPIAVDKEHVAHGTADKSVLSIEHQALEHGLVLPFAAGEHLLEAVQ